MQTPSQFNGALRPACDHCKAARVRCLSRTAADGTDCPRCVDKGFKCTITPIQRGRPKKSPPTSESPQPIASTSNLQPVHISSHSTENQMTTLVSQNQMMVQLLDTFRDLPQANHASKSRRRLADLVHSCSPPSAFSSQQTTLLHAMLAVAALASPYFASMTTAAASVPLYKQSAQKLAGMDLRVYGKARLVFYESLRQKAYVLAKEEEVTVECSEDNAVTCMLLDFLDSRDKRRPSRPYATAYLSHLRHLADEAFLASSYSCSGRRIDLAGLTMEALNALVAGKPIPVSTQDMYTFCGTADTNLEPALARLRGDFTGDYKHVDECFVPYCLSIIKLAKDGYRIFLSPQGRSHDLDVREVMTFLDSLTSLAPALDLVEMQKTLAFISQSSNTTFAVDKLSYFFTTAYCALFLPAYREITRRGLSGASQTEHEHFERMSVRVRQETVSAAVRVSDAVRSVSAISYLTHVTYDSTEEWCQILLAEGATAKAMGIDIHASLKCLVQGLKLAGYSNVDSSGTIDVADLHIAMEEMKRASQPNEVIWMNENKHAHAEAQVPHWDWTTVVSM